MVEDHHGELVPDPYRPLEDLDADETVRWVRLEQGLTEAFLAEVPSRQDIRDHVALLWDYPRAGIPMQRGKRWFQMRNSGLQPQPVLYVAGGPTGEGRVLIDPGSMSDDGTTALSQLAISRDGTLVAYALSQAGSDWMTWRVRDAETGTDLPDEIHWAKFSGAAWAPDLSGFWYGGAERPPAGEELTAATTSLRIFFHRLGTSVNDDAVVFEAPDERDWIPSVEVTEDGRYLVVTVGRGTAPETLVLVRDLHDPEAGLAALTSPFESQDIVVASLPGGGLVVQTDRDAERGRLVLAIPGQPPAEWAELVPEAVDTLLGASHCGGRLVCHYLHDAHSRLRVHHLDGAVAYEVALPGIASVVSGSGGPVEGRAESTVAHYQVVSFTEPGAVYWLAVDTGETGLLFRSESTFDGSRYTTEQVFVDSDDGTKVPLFLVRPAGATADGTARVLLYGYGGFNVPITPAFSVTFASWLDRGGMVAVAALRGGGEYGRGWHDAGRLSRKQNVFDDFAACARWLESSGWSRPSRIAINGGSNGGLLVGASITQHPELFGAAIADVGVFDMLRFHLFTIGWAWKSDYGDPDDAAEYEWLRSYSPLHNIEAGRCPPPTMITTGDHDDRVVPAHSFKFAAALQAAQSCPNPILLRVSIAAGHGAGKPTGKMIDETADRLAFLEAVLDPPSPPPGISGRP